MYEHFPLLAAHAATAAFLALIVALICRRVRHAAVVHVLWVVVLLKLITPRFLKSFFRRPTNLCLCSRGRKADR